ncbi:MAG: T9SS C-terminal target domain-containing protein [Balneolaceae bacterium]|nr:MAG: T9SS C-terminal target domain-containing protein [Balneolaceae bacterium]
MKRFYYVLLASLLASISIFNVELSAQDLSSEEIERKEQIRERLLQDGYLQPLAIPVFSQADSFILSDAWHTGKTLNSVSLNSRANDISSNGTRFYVVGREDQHIVEYQLSEPWDISTAEYLRELDVSNELTATEGRESAPHGIYFRKGDGTKMWLMNRTEIWEYTLSEPWNITTAQVTGRGDLIDYVVRGHDLDFRPDGRVLYIDDRELQAVFQFNLATPWDVSTLSLDYVLDISSVEVEIRGTQFSSDGHQVFFTDTGRKDIMEFSVANAYDLRSAAFTNAYNIISEAFSPVNMTLSPDGRSFYVTDGAEDVILMYRISVIDPEESSIVLSETNVDADGSSFSEVSVSVKDSDGYRFSGVVVELVIDGGTPNVEVINNITDGEGTARFRLRNERAETVNISATADNEGVIIALEDNPALTFKPPAPVILAATNVNTRSFEANWELVPNADSYLLDVAKDSNFDSFVSGFRDFEVGNVTSYLVENLNPGKVYYYRVKAKSGEITGNFADSAEVSLFPDVPLARNPGDIAATSFTASWERAEGAESYLLQVSADENFESVVNQQEATDDTNIIEKRITGLNPGSTYYYRVKSLTERRESAFSGSISATTLGIDRERSKISSAQLRVLANGEQENEITVVIKTPDGSAISGELISLTPLSGNSEVSIIENSTDEQGTAKFSVSNSVAETVEYEVLVSDVFMLGTISVEFLAANNQLTIGDNYPNPFQRQTTIPLTVPAAMNVKIVVSNVLGSHVKTILDEQLEAGYYEIAVSLNGLASGTYFYRLITSDGSETRKMMLIN